MTVLAEFDPERALPNVLFRDQAIFDAEIEHIWRTDWIFVTTEDAVAEPGDQLPVTIAGQPVLLIRNQEGELGAVSNLCAHRGTLLVEEANNAKRIQCPYHAWTYNDAGRLLSVPFADRDEIDKAEHCLPAYRVEAWHGLVFVNLSADAEPLATRFAAIESLMNERGIDDLHHWSTHQSTDTWECNWKLAVLNAMESYHLFQVHPETLEPYSPTKGAYYITGSARATATGGTSKDQPDYVLISLPPGFVGVFTHGTFVWQAVDPTSPGTCTVRFGGAYSSPPPDRAGSRASTWLTKATSAVANMALPDFLPEDKAICERGQRGASGDFTPGALLDVERVVADFGYYLNWRLNQVQPPPAQATG